MDDPNQRVTLRLDRSGVPAVDLRTVELEVEVVAGADAGARRRVLTDTLRIGARAGNDLVLTDPSISGRHAEIRRVGDDLELVDLGSTNGTFRGGARVERTPLRAGDDFQVGRTTLRVRLVEDRRRSPIGDAGRLGALIGATPAMQNLYAMLRALGPTGASVLITGETGTGKELVARELHRLSGREGDLVAFDAGSADPSQIASALFGHRKGAFTGAVDERAGAARSADGGTLFLDEIGELPLELQPRLLRLLERREVTPLGADRPTPLDIRVVAATHRDLRAAVAAGGFRQDLLHRLAVVEVEVPPLRERRGDLPALVEAMGRDLGDPPVITDEGWSALRNHGWPGNVRELKNCLQRAVALSGGRPAGAHELGLSPAPPLGAPPAPGAAPAFGAAPAPGATAAPGSVGPGAPPAAPALPGGDASLEDLEKAAILAVLRRHDGHRKRSAAELGISLTTLKRRLRKFRLDGDWVD